MSDDQEGRSWRDDPGALLFCASLIALPIPAGFITQTPSLGLAAIVAPWFAGILAAKGRRQPLIRAGAAGLVGSVVAIGLIFAAAHCVTLNFNATPPAGSFMSESVSREIGVAICFIGYNTICALIAGYAEAAPRL